jgi:hypothetical protein
VIRLTRHILERVVQGASVRNDDHHSHPLVSLAQPYDKLVNDWSI